MSSRSLTGSRRRSEARRAATCPMIVFAIAAVSPLASAGAQERPPPASLIDRGLRHAGLAEPNVSAQALAAARWLPELRLTAIVERGDGSGLTRASTTVLGQLSWPLGRTGVADTLAAERDARWRSQARERLADRIAEAWQRRRHAEELADDLAARLAEDEADAELEAIVGEDVP